MRLRGIVALALVVLSGCSGGGGGGGGNSAPPAQPPATPTTVTGTAAADTALAGVRVEALAPSPRPPFAGNSAFVFFADSAPDGSYSITSSAEVRPPFLIHIPGFTPGVGFLPFEESDARYPSLYSLAIRGGTANVTPLTQLAITRLLNRRLAYLSDIRALFELQNVTESQLAAARQQVVDYLIARPSKDNGNLQVPVDVSAVSNFFSMPMTAAPGDPYFDALRRLHESLMESESLFGVEEHMLFRNDTPADLSTVLSLDFTAHCTLEPPDPTSFMPQGLVRIVLNPLGATVGSVNLAFQSGDLVNLDASHVFSQQWLFTFTGRASSLALDVFEARLNDVKLTVIGASSNCVPVSDLPFAGKHPSMIALTRRFAQSIGNPTAANPAVFQCSAANPFFQSGANQIAIEANGALRINGAAGPALHLPSLNIGIGASITVPAAGQVAIQPTRFTASRTFRGGLRDLTVALNGAGQITGLKLTSQRNGQPSQSQTCGVI